MKPHRRLYLTVSTVIIIITGFSYWAFWHAMKAETNVRYFGLQKMMAERMEKTFKGMEMSANNIFKEVAHHLESPEDVVKALESQASLNPDVRGYFAAFEPYYFKKEGRWFEPYVHHQEGKPYEMTQVGCESHDYTQSPWYVSAKEKKEAFWSDPYYYNDGTEISGHYTTYVKPIFDKDGQLVCVCGADITFDWLDRELERINNTCINESEVNQFKMGRDLEFYTVVVNAEGTCILHPSEKYVPIDDPKVLDDLKNGGSGKLSMIIDGTPSTLYYGPIEGLGWTVMVVMPTVDIQKPFIYTGIILALLALVGILITWLICRNLGKTKESVATSHHSSRIGSRG